MPVGYKITYMITGPLGDLYPSVARIDTEEGGEEFVARLRYGFHDKNAGHDWWVMPGAILNIQKISDKHRPLPWSQSECKCIVKGCENLSGKGAFFQGMLCPECYSFLTSGLGTNNAIVRLVRGDDNEAVGKDLPVQDDHH
jgi:hypothetical protein